MKRQRTCHKREKDFLSDKFLKMTEVAHHQNAFDSWKEERHKPEPPFNDLYILTIWVGLIDRASLLDCQRMLPIIFVMTFPKNINLQSF